MAGSLGSREGDEGGSLDADSYDGDGDGDGGGTASLTGGGGSLVDSAGSQHKGSVSSDHDDDEPVADPTQMALPTMLMAGTIWGSIFRADLSKNKVDVETNNLRKFLQGLLVPVLCVAGRC